jgi:hypothetical protein
MVIDGDLTLLAITSAGEAFDDWYVQREAVLFPIFRHCLQLAPSRGELWRKSS